MRRTILIRVVCLLVAVQLLVTSGCGQKPFAEPTRPSMPVSIGDDFTDFVDFPVTILKGHTSVIYSVAFSPDGKTLASGSEDGESGIKLWDVATGTFQRSLPGKTSFALSVQFHPDGKRLASTSGWDAVVRLWDLSKDGEPVTFEAPFGKEGAGSTITDQDGVTTYSAQIQGVSFHPEGKLMATAGPGRLVRVWDIETKKLVTTLPVQPGTVMNVAFSPDGKSLATASCGQNNMNEPGSLKLWDTATWKETWNVPDIISTVKDIAFRPKGTTLVSGEFEGTLRLWDIVNKQASTIAPRETAGSRALAFSPDGETVAHTNRDAKVYLVPMENGKRLRTLKGESPMVRSLAFSPDGKTLATACIDQTIRMWKLKD
jgi:WD40 repeat protein